MEKNRAFTLIELLFVIAILGVFTSTGMMFVHGNVQQVRMNKAAQQIQQLLQAGMAYHVDNACWPGQSESGAKNTDVNCKNPDLPFDSNNYIPIASVAGKPNKILNPWGYSYYWGKVSGNKFQVRTNAPNEAIASQVVGMLPSAEAMAGDCVSGGKCQVVAETVIPSQIAESTTVKIAAVGDVTFTFDSDEGHNTSHDSQYQSVLIDKPVCPKSMPNMFVSLRPQSLTYQGVLKNKDWSPYLNYILDFSIDSNNEAICRTRDKNKQLCITYKAVGGHCSFQRVGFERKNADYDYISRIDCAGYDNNDGRALLSSAEVNYVIYCCEKKSWKDHV